MSDDQEPTSENTQIEVELRRCVSLKKVVESGEVFYDEIDLGQYMIYVKIGQDPVHRVGYVADNGPINFIRNMHDLTGQVVCLVLEMLVELGDADAWSRAYYAVD